MTNFRSDQKILVSNDFISYLSDAYFHSLNRLLHMKLRSINGHIDNESRVRSIGQLDNIAVFFQF
jgi:hypothetical protein